MHTDIQYQSFSRGFWCIDAKRPHTSDDWTDEVNVEDGKEVDDVEDDGQGQKAHAPETRHGQVSMRAKGVCGGCGTRICAPRSPSCPQGVSSTLPSSESSTTQAPPLRKDTPDAWKASACTSCELI